MFLFAFQMVFASTSESYVGDFLTPTRQDAPVDGMLVFYGNYNIDAVLTYGGNTVVLPTEALVQSTYGRFSSPDQRVVYPPAGGWPVGVPLEVTVVDSPDYYDPRFDSAYVLSFQSDGHLAADPPNLTSLQGDVTAWNYDETLPWSCCGDIRSVEVSLDLFSSIDAWAGVLISPIFPSTYSTTGDRNFSLGLGEEAYEQEVVQWMEYGGLQPECYLVQSLSEAGELGVENTLCVNIEVGDAPAQGVLGDVILPPETSETTSETTEPSTSETTESTEPTEPSTDPNTTTDTGSAEDPNTTSNKEGSGCSTTNAPLGGLSGWFLLLLVGLKRQSERR